MHESATTNEKFLRTLSSGLHGLAQPLSIIHGYLEISLQDGASIEQYRELTKKLLQQSRRAAGIAKFVSQLTRYQLPAPDVQDILLTSVLEQEIEDRIRVFETAQVQLDFRHPKHELLVRISPIRLRQVIGYILDVIRMVSAPGDMVRIEVRSDKESVSLHVQRQPSIGYSPRTLPGNDDNAGSHALTLADAIVSNAGGSFSSSLEPLSIRADFPVA